MPRTQMGRPQPGNRLLTFLRPDEYDRLRRHLRPVRMEAGQVLVQAGQPIEYAYFPTSGLVSALTLMAGGDAIEVGMVGKEGVAGVTAGLGVFASPYQNLVQVAGDALRADADAVARECERDGLLRRALFGYHTYFLSQVSQAAACNGLHSVRQRCCRWLLMAHDRVGSDDLPFTHEFVATMLGVRRVSVTLLLQSLYKRRVVRSGRGRITVLSRKGLEAAVCECYQQVRDQYARLLGGTDGGSGQ